MNGMTTHATPPALSARFLPPPGWQWQIVHNDAGQAIRCGTASPADPIATVVCLPGLSEYGEKYFELAHDLLDRNLAVWVVDWRGQGLSHRALPNRHKRHSTGFESDLADLDLILRQIGRERPLVMLAHSMGGNIGLRYLAAHDNVFSAAAFSAPMTGIAATSALPARIALALAWVLQLLFGKRYVFGGGDWSPRDRETPARNVFSTDPVRAAVHNRWCRDNPDLQAGNITFGWLYHALRSCAALQRAIRDNPVKIPCLFALAGGEKLVDNAATRRLAANLPAARIIDFPDSLHEILMERESIRAAFLGAFDRLLQDVLKPH